MRPWPTLPAVLLALGVMAPVASAAKPKSPAPVRSRQQKPREPTPAPCKVSSPAPRANGPLLRRSPLVPAACKTSSPESRSASLSKVEAKRLPRKLRLITYQETWEGTALTPKGAVIPEARTAIAKLLKATGSRPMVPDRLIQLMVMTSHEFGGRPLFVVSGYRAQSYYSDSRHRHSAAVDFSIVGVRNADLRNYLLTLSNVGVGYYPNSSFVHLDVRNENTAWVDYAGPGEPPRLTPRRHPQTNPPAQLANADGDREHEPDVSIAVASDSSRQPIAKRSERDGESPGISERPSEALDTPRAAESIEAPADAAAKSEANESRDADSVHVAQASATDVAN